MRYFVISAVAVVLFTFSACLSEGNPEAEKAAIESATSWLELVDKEDYAESWDVAADYFIAAISREQWEQSIRSVRSPLGRVNSRTLKSKKYATSLLGAPDGKYVVIQYKTSFENKKNAVETITPMLDTDGKWRVSGYYIK